MEKLLEDDAQKAKDLETTEQSLNITGKSDEELQAMLENLKNNMRQEIDKILQDIVTKDILNGLRK